MDNWLYRLLACWPSLKPTPLSSDSSDTFPSPPPFLSSFLSVRPQSLSRWWRVPWLSDWKRKVTAEYEPTDAQRSLVESASAFGITQAEIATQLKISEPTLRKHFREELDGGAFKAK